MQTISIDDPRTKHLVQTMLEKRNLVPILGAGFSKGQRTTNSRVPDGEEFRQIMLRAIQAAIGSEEIKHITTKKFSEVAEYFSNPDFVKVDTRKSLIRKHFTGVVLDDKRREFLDCNWPYIYTLNIDDAIESNSRFRYAIVPYQNISRTAKEFECVYKVHGDAMHEIMYEDSPSIIFSTDSYVQSLITNQSMLASLRTDLVEQNTLFVGCSLDYEIDLLYALANYRGEFSPGRQSIYVSTQQPNRFDVAKLKKHGVNAVMIVPNYDTFYDFFVNLSASIAVDTVSHSQPFRIDRVDSPLSGDRKSNLDFLFRAPSSKPIAAGPALPDFYFKRDILPLALEALNSEGIVLIRGRRFSGRSLLLRGIAAEAISRNIFLFSSEVEVSPEVIKELAGIRNGLFLFDTNSLTSESVGVLMASKPSFQSNSSAIAIAVNRTEPDIAGAIAPHVTDAADFELEAYLSSTELARLNARLDALGIRRFRNNKTILNNTIELLAAYKYEVTDLTAHRVLTDEEKDVLLIVTIMDKCHSNLATVLGLRGDRLFAFAEKMAPLIDLLETHAAELRETHSRRKLVPNSQLGIRLFVNHIVNDEGPSGVAGRLFGITSRLLAIPEFREVGRRTIMFDAINYLLADLPDSEISTGYRRTVLSLYEKLQPILNDSADYWLQRAKASMNLETDVQSLLEGVGFAKKAHAESTRERTVDNAEFTIALLFGKLCVVTEYKKLDYVLEAISWFYRAVTNFANNSNYVRTLLLGDRHRKNSFHRLCDHLAGPVNDPKLLTVKPEVDYLLSVYRTFGAGRRR